VIDPRHSEVAAPKIDPERGEVGWDDGHHGAEVEADVVIVGVGELRVGHGVQFYSDDGGPVLGGARGVEEPQVATGNVERGEAGETKKEIVPPPAPPAATAFGLSMTKRNLAVNDATTVAAASIIFILEC
jgi:hypothetical protein